VRQESRHAKEDTKMFARKVKGAMPSHEGPILKNQLTKAFRWWVEEMWEKGTIDLGSIVSIACTTKYIGGGDKS